MHRRAGANAALLPRSGKTLAEYRLPYTVFQAWRAAAPYSLILTVTLNERFVSLCRFVGRRWRLTGWRYKLFLLPNSFKRVRNARRRSAWNIDRPGRRVDLADATHHVGNARFLVKQPDSDAVGRSNEFMTRLPRKRLQPEHYQPEHDMESRPPDSIRAIA
jgi:hypothetical protein